MSSKGGGGVAFRAHIGGFVAGMVLVAVFKRREFRLFNPLRREERSSNWPRR
jgi:membrane associated rhomboid family serine protease